MVIKSFLIKNDDKNVTALFSFGNFASPFIILNPKLLFNVFIFSLNS